MPKLKINDRDVTVEPGTLLIEACRQAGFEVPHYCYHPSLTPVATCRMCMVEVKGQPKLVASCATPAAEGMEVDTRSAAVQDARGAVMEFLLLNHPLDCPICDQAGECRLQDYSYVHGSGESRMAEPRRRYAYEDLGAKIVLDKNRCIHCTRCVRFTRELSRTDELVMVNRGARLELTAYDGRSLDGNPLAGNLADLCPVGALTSRDFRFTKRVWYLKPVPTISRHGVQASPIWADVDENRVWRFRPRPQEGRPWSAFILDEEREAFHRYDLDPATRVRSPRMGGRDAESGAVAEALRAAGPAAVVAQGTFGCEAVRQLARLAAEGALYGSGDRVVPVRVSELQPSEDGIFNRKGLAAQGYRFGRLDELEARLASGELKAVVLLQDEAFSSPGELERLRRILGAAAFSLVLEPIPSALSGAASATLPVTTYLEEEDAVLNLHGESCPYRKALEPPRGVRSVPAWVEALLQVPALP